jgi:hypothetical protein
VAGGVSLPSWRVVKGGDGKVVSLSCKRRKFLGFLTSEERLMVSGVNSGRGFSSRDHSYAVVLLVDGWSEVTVRVSS